MVRVPKHMYAHWEKLIGKESTASTKVYAYGFTDAANRCGLESMKAFNKCVNMAQIEYSKED